MTVLDSILITLGEELLVPLHGGPEVQGQLDLRFSNFYDDVNSEGQQDHEAKAVLECR